MTLKVYTSTIQYLGPNRLDISVKSGYKAFAPTWGMVHGLKNGGLKKDTYAEQYRQLMHQSHVQNTDAWVDLLTRDEVVLCCYCSPGKFCHRRILAGILEKMGCVVVGEILPVGVL